MLGFGYAAPRMVLIYPQSEATSHYCSEKPEVYLHLVDLLIMECQLPSQVFISCCSVRRW